MRNYIKQNSWKIIEEGFNSEQHKNSESLFSIGNGHMGQRANFEEHYSGPSLQGHYIAGIYYPDKTKVGWWKNGYPEYFAKVLNAPAWIGIDVKIGHHRLDLFTCKVTDFKRTLDMKKGLLSREFTAEFTDGKKIRVEARRFLSIVRREIGTIRYSITALNFSAELKVDFFLDADISNQDSNYDEKFWEPITQKAIGDISLITAKTKKTEFIVTTAQCTRIEIDNLATGLIPSQHTEVKKAHSKYQFQLEEGQTAQLYKYVSITTSRDYENKAIEKQALDVLKNACSAGFSKLEEEQANAWDAKWKDSDIVIEGDLSAQQGIRFNIFQLIQTYSGHDARLNIGPKGFTGEKYGGSTYWDTEAYCLPFYLSTSDEHIPRNLLLYRYKQLDKAIENARKLGFTNGAALYPMVTMNGEECHNEWEITFEEIHRNGAIAFAIFNYIRHTGEESYLYDYGLEVLVALSRFWAQRINFSEARQQYVMLGVTGPNEYENNVNNNWYTSYIAIWTLKYTLEGISKMRKLHPFKANTLFQRINLDPEKETILWKEIIDKMYFAEDQSLGIFLQQDGYLDKEQILASELAPFERPINQNWSWDRILRSCFIKQADVLQGIYLFEEDFSEEEIRRNFEFYEPRTVHESSLSPCIHVVLASKLGLPEKAYELYLRTSRLDLDDYNHEVHEGCHITSMAGTWLSVVEGFGGMRVKDDALHFNPLLPSAWKSLHFKVRFRGRFVQVKIEPDAFTLIPLDGKPFRYFIEGKERIAH